MLQDYRVVKGLGGCVSGMSFVSRVSTGLQRGRPVVVSSFIDGGYGLGYERYCFKSTQPVSRSISLTE